MREVSQEVFDEACRISDQIADLRDKKRQAGTLLEKLNIQFEISRLITKHRQVLGLD